MEIGTFFFSLISGWWKEKLKVYLYFFKLSSWKHISSRRKSLNSIRKINDKELLRLFTGKILFQDISNPILNHIANPIFNLYFIIIKMVIFW